MSIHITDVVAATAVVVTSVLLVPVYNDLMADFTAEAGALASLLAELFLPLLFLGIIISIGVSARRGA